RDQCRDEPLLLDGLPALGLRPAVDDLRSALPLRTGQAQHPRRQRAETLRPGALAARQVWQAGLRGIAMSRPRLATTVRPRESGHPELQLKTFPFGPWVPAFAGTNRDGADTSVKSVVRSTRWNFPQAAA